MKATSTKQSYTLPHRASQSIRVSTSYFHVYQHVGEGIRVHSTSPD